MSFPLAFAAFIVPCVLSSAPIPWKKPLSESGFVPDILFLDFNQQETASVTGTGAKKWRARIDKGKVKENPKWVKGPSPVFKDAIEFNYGGNRDIARSTTGNVETPGNHLVIEDNRALRLQDEKGFTLGAWIEAPARDVPDGGFKHIFSKGGTSGTVPGWGVFLHRGGGDDSWYLVVQIVDKEGNNTWSDYNSPGCARLPEFKPGRWQHVGVTFNPADKKLCVFLNGKEVHNTVSNAALGETELPLLIGERGTSTYNNFPIKIDELFITSGCHTLE